jgi:hypothetical protein
VTLTLFLTCLLFSRAADARVVFVRQNASGPTHDGASWSTACLTVTSGLTAATSGDEVWVAGGTYQEAVEPGKGVSLYGGFVGTETQRVQRNWKANPTILDGGATDGDLVACHFGGIVVDGFTMRRGSCGARIGPAGVATLANDAIVGNSGYGVYIDGIATITSCVIADNNVAGVICPTGFSLDLLNNSVCGNGGDGVYVSSRTARIVNNTIAGNGSDGCDLYTGTVTLDNNLVAFNGAAGVRVNYAATLSSCSHNDVSGNARGEYVGYAAPAGKGNISLDPKLSSINSNIHIQPDSPCRDAGDSALAVGDSDFDNQPRIQGASVDMGADESDGTAWPARSTVWYVSTSGRDAADGRTWGSARKTVGAALADAQGDDEVWVAGGTYSECVSPTTGVALYGGFAGAETDRGQRDWKANPTILDRGHSTTSDVVTCGLPRIAVDGFTIQNGRYGCYVAAGGSVRLAHNELRGNVCGLYVYYGSAAADDCALSGNSQDGAYVDNGTMNLLRGGALGNARSGVYVSNGAATVAETAIGASNVGIYLFNSSATLTGNTVFGNNGTAISVSGTAALANNRVVGNGGSGVYVTGTATLVNNTVTVNGGDGIYVSSGKGTLANNISAHNGGYGTNKGSSGTIAAFSHNDVFGNAKGEYAGFTPLAGQGNLSVDPGLSNRYHDLHIQPDSPCRDAGDSASAITTTDVDGQPRIQDASVDIGADESDGTLWSVPPVIWHVSPAGNDANDGKSWAATKRTVGGALKAAYGGDEVWVSAGTYIENVAPPVDVALYGGFAGTEAERSQRDWQVNQTVLDGGAAADVVTCRFHGIVLDGFAIRNGKNGVNVFAGGGAAAVVHDAVFNNAVDGVYVAYSATAALDGSTVSGNGNAGVESSGAATVTNCTLSGNGVYGVYVSSGATTLTGATICNSGVDGVNGYAGKVSMTNNIVAFNGHSGVAETNASFTAFSHNDVYGNVAGSYYGYYPPANRGNISADPLLSSLYRDIHLQPGSPCRDAGDSAAATTSGDIDGQPRFQGASVDIGSDESDGTTWNVPAYVWHVAPSGDDGADGLTWATAKRTVGAALMLARGGDEVWLTSGTYRETVSPRSGVALYGGFSGSETARAQRDGRAQACVLNAPDSVTDAVSLAFRDITLDGFTLCNGRYGANVATGGSATLAHITARENEAGIYISGGPVTLTGSAISFNQASGVTVRSSAAATLIGNAFVGNGAAGVEVAGTATLANNVVSGNSTGVLLNGDRALATLVNNTISASGIDGVYVQYGSLKLSNNIVGFSGRYGVNAENGPVLACVCNDVFGNARGDFSNYVPPTDKGNLAQDPRLSSIYHDIHIQPDSPCVDAGSSAAAIGAVDIDGQARIQGAAVDIGADEGDGTVWDVPKAVWHVSPSGDDGKDGLSWGAARKTVGSALGSALGGDEVWVASGAYAEGISPAAGVALYGGFAGTETGRDQRNWKNNATILDASGSAGSVLTCAFRGILVDGFTLRNGYSGVAISGTATLRNNALSGGEGNGVDVRGSAVLSGNTISGARQLGVNVDAHSVAILTGNAISGNGFGGVTALTAQMTMTGNTVSGNTGFGVRSGGSMALICGNVIVDNDAGVAPSFTVGSFLGNNIIAFNHEKGVDPGNGPFEACSHNDVYGNAGSDYVTYPPAAELGNISRDPLFVDRAHGDFHLTAGSPCIDAGDDSLISIGQRDGDGRARIIGQHVDIGAYEFGALGPRTMQDAIDALKVSGGLQTLGAEDAIRLNVDRGAPSFASVDLFDAVRLIRAAAGLEPNQ